MPSEPERAERGEFESAAPVWHALHSVDVVAALDSDAREGLSEDEAARRLVRFGANAIREPRRRSWQAVFLGQLRSPLIYLLGGAAALSLAMGRRHDAIVIFVVVLFNAVIGAYQEGRAERSLQAVRRIATLRVRAVRGGRQTQLAARDVVPGDVLLVEAGDAIVADARIVDGAALQIAEAALTGESVPVGKDVVPLARDTPLADRANMIFAGTHVTAGRARVVVVETGQATEIGHIAALAEAAPEPETPLERRVAQLGRSVIFVSAGLFALIVAIGHLRGFPLAEIATVAISQVVSVVPEGLPVALTIALAVGVQRMARRHTIVRRLAAVETLGSTTVICSDKTGTLTRNEMTATAIVLPRDRMLDVTGIGYAPVGRIRQGDREVDGTSDEDLRELLEAAVLCNDAALRGPESPDEGWTPIGDPTEVALVALAIKGGLVPRDLRAARPRRAELPFDPKQRMMATQHDSPGGPFVVIKGAPEAVLALCARDARFAMGVGVEPSADRPAAFSAAAAGLAARALRVLAFAVVPGGEIDGRSGFSALHGKARLLGLIGQIDPPRPEAKEAVARCREAGIRAVMVTGDHRSTGLAIARELGIARDGDLAVDGSELERMSDAELAERIDAISVFARVHPAQKLRIVEAYQGRGEVVAMTGDGVNDAPALARADVGVAMGRSGTEVAKEAARIVIGDDDFATLVAAVEEGRIVYRNVKKILLYLLSTSVDEVILLLAALFLGYPPPLAAVQILWINLVTEGAVTVHLVMDPAEGDEMRRPPVSPREPLLSRALLARMAFMTPSIVASTFGWFLFRLSEGLPFAQVQAETFSVLALCQWFNVLNCRSETRSAFGSSLLGNPWLGVGLAVSLLLQVAVVFFRPLGEVFHTVPLELETVGAIVVVASLVLWVEEARKTFVRLTHRWR